MSLGLDIGSKTIKLVELNREGKKYSLKSAGVVGYTGADVEKLKDERELASLAGIIKKLVKDVKISSKIVSISLPETLVFTRVMKFPLLTDQEIASAVKWEAEEYIPIPLKDAVVEHVILERQEVGNPPQVLVLLTAVRRELVEKYVRVCDLAGLKVNGVETELMSDTRSLAPPEKTVMIVDLGAKSTDIAIVRNEQMFLSRSIPTAGDAFSRAVAQALGVSLKQAEEYKRTYGLSREQLEGKVGSALLTIIKGVSGEIKKAISYYQLDIKGEAPSSIILVGGGAGLPELSTTLTRLLGSEVVIGNPFAKIQVALESNKGLRDYAPLYSSAVGLAMREE